MGRSNTHEKIVLKKGPWTREEDQKLLDYIAEHGHGSWRALPAKAGLQRCGKSCRLRWANYLRPDIKRGKFSPQEEKTIIRLHALLGNRWSAIATHLPKRTDNEIKNYWNTRLKKRLTRMGIDPATHKHKDNLGNSSSAVISHMAQWETARLEAEARLVGECKAKVTSTAPAPPTHPLPPCLDVLKVWQATSQYGFFSPTSTLNSSGSRVLNENGYLQAKGKTDNLPELVHAHYSVDYDDAVKRMITGGSMEIQTINCDGYHNFGTSACVGDFEDNKNYWNELFNLVNSPTL